MVDPSVPKLLALISRPGCLEVLSHCSNGPQSVGQLAEALDLPRRRIRDLAAALVTAGHLEATPGGFVARPVDEWPALVGRLEAFAEGRVLPVDPS